jgi:hypothetical protein
VVIPDREGTKDLIVAATVRRGLVAAGIATLVLSATSVVASAGRPPKAGATGGDYLRLRAEYEARLRGIEPGRFADPSWRTNAIETEQQQEARERLAPNAVIPAWAPIGPDSVNNGQAVDDSNVPVSGRVTSIAVDPTNSSKVYLGTAQGGVWRSLNGGSTWTAIFDSAQSLSIGALAIAPSSPSTLYVGTGESNESIDSFFGVGVYRIDNADTAATLAGPINPQMTFGCNPASCIGSFTTTAFGGRSVSRILVDPTNAATIFVSTTTGFGGFDFNQLSNVINPLGVLGVYRSTNATAAAASVTFQKLAVSTGVSVDSPPTGNRSITDMTFVNGSAGTLVAAADGTAAAGDGGIFRSINALAATPTFTRTLQGPLARVALANSAATVLAATAENVPNNGGVGRLRASTDGGASWPTVLAAADGFCGTQCGYDIAVAIDPHSVAPNLRIYLGGSLRGTHTDAMKVSSDGGTTFTRDDGGLHADTHAIVFDALTNPSTVWTGNDGGVWKRAADAVGQGWQDLNTGLATLQMQSIAVGKADPYLTLAGTQDNGTLMQSSFLGNWTQADFGDGGFALVDQSTTSFFATLYHTYFNESNVVVGFARASSPFCAYKGGWEFRGFGPGTLHTACDGSPTPAGNNIDGSEPVEFYPPIALGAGTPNTLYFGTDRLYGSSDQGDTMSVVSQAPFQSTVPLTAIGVSLRNDNVRIVGLQNGRVFATATGSSPLVDITSGAFPANPADPNGSNKWVSRAVVDPNNPNTAYITFAFYAPAGTGIWKITNLAQALSGSQAPNWAPVANGIPSVPIDAFVVDPNDSTHLYAGTDIGVYESTDWGATWHPFGSGLPRVAVFDMAIAQPTTNSEVLRIATHGRSVWQAALPPFATRAVADFNGDGTTDPSVFRPSEGRWYPSGSTPVNWGLSTDILTPGRYRGGSPTDIAIFRPSEGRWYVNGGAFTNWGISGDVPVPGNYEGGAMTDVAVYRPSEGRWYVRGQAPVDWGTTGDIPVPGDYDNDGITDIAVYRPSEGRWYIKFSSGGQLTLRWGIPGDIPVPGDYDGNGSTDAAVYRPSEGRWYVNAGAFTFWGTSGDMPEPGDYDGDGITDLAVYRPSEGRWYIRQSKTLTLSFTNWGLSTDVPLPLPYAIRRVFFP